MGNLETREPKWWAVLNRFVMKHRLGKQRYDELFEIICDAIQEDAAVEMGHLGGVKGGKARAAALTPEARAAAASKAANARWKKHD